MRLWQVALLSLFSPRCFAEEGPPPMAMMAQRLMQSLPELPQIIQAQMQGRPDELKKMVSSVLGDGLISQLVVNPVGVAEEMGMSADSLGINKTEMMQKLNNATNGLASAYLDSKPEDAVINNKTSIFGNLPGEKVPKSSKRAWKGKKFGRAFLNRDTMGRSRNYVDETNLFTTTPPTTTTTIMYVEGKPIENFDEFIRKHNIVDADGRPMFNTQKPPPTTTPAPSAQDIAESVLQALQKNGVGAQSTPLPPQPSADQFNFGLIDPTRVGEVNHILRRAPQHFDTLSDDPHTAPVAPLDPPISNVLTTLRTKSFSGLTVEEVKQLQGALQQYEQTLQTKELFAKRKQLEILQNELVEQKKRIEEQRRMEEELRKKERELEQKRLEMEIQLQKQLNSWHSSFNSHNPGVEIPTLSPIQLGSAEVQAAVTQSATETIQMEVTSTSPAPPSREPVVPSDNSALFGAAPGLPPPSLGFNAAPSFSIRPTAMRKHISEEALAEAEPSLPVKSPLSQLRYSREEVETQQLFEHNQKPEQHDGDFSSTCECVEVSMEKMQGAWVPALASANALKKAQTATARLTGGSTSSQMTCSRYEFTSPKTSQAAQEARVTWEFRTADSRRRYMFSGNALSIDYVTTRVQMKDLNGNRVTMPFCVLKAGGENRYSYMVIVNAAGPCREATLLVRDPNTFFDKQNLELVKFLKHTISQGSMDQMDIVPYADDCH